MDLDDENDIRVELPAFIRKDIAQQVAINKQ